MVLMWWGNWRGGVEHIDEHQTEGHQQHNSGGDHVLQCATSEIKAVDEEKYLIVLNFVAQKATKRPTPRNMMPAQPRDICMQQLSNFIQQTISTQNILLSSRKSRKNSLFKPELFLGDYLENCVRTKLNLNQMANGLIKWVKYYY